RKIQHSDVMAFYRRWVGPKNAALIVTGDVTLEQATAWGERFFGAWQSSAVRPPRPPPAPTAVRRRVVYDAVPGLDQTVVVAGAPAIASDAPDKASLELALNALGGAFGSRLNLNLREDKGYTYSSYALLDSRRGAGTWFAQASVRADVTGP